MTNRYRAGQPCTPQMPIDFAGDEPEDVETVDQFGADVLAVLGWFVLTIFALLLIAVVAGYWSMS